MDRGSGRGIGRGRWGALLVVGLALLLIAYAAWLRLGGDPAPPESSESSETGPETEATPADPSQRPDAEAKPGRTGFPRAPETDDPALEAALSEPVEDSVYPAVGDPGVDALHYALNLTWDPTTATLTGRERIVVRATSDADHLQFDFAAPLEATRVLVDGEAVTTRHTGKDLVILTDVTADSRHTVEINYTGQPRPVDAPTERGDITSLGWTVTDTGETWTMQEPFGAYSWYAVNDQPADKALYDFRLTAPDPLVGVANGEHTDSSTAGGRTTQDWHLADPASSYLVTVAFGDFQRTDGVTDSGTPVTWWTPRDDPSTLRDLRRIIPAMAWSEERLGPYPWPTLNLVMVDSESAMETQSTITFGNNSYIRSPEVLLHELIHQWYGDLVTPRDWRDVWLNEGMTMYLQGVWEAEREGISLDRKMNNWASFEPDLRREAGPPGAYDAELFGSGNIYYGPALMWHELRGQVGDEVFWQIVKEWPRSRTDAHFGATRDDLYAFVEEATGRELTAFFDAWVMGQLTPTRTP
ncbi:MAG: M1 family metallopeptidase [Nocardioides sp.]